MIYILCTGGNPSYYFLFNTIVCIVDQLDCLAGELFCQRVWLYDCWCIVASMDKEDFPHVAI